MSLSRSDPRDDFTFTEMAFLQTNTEWKGFKILLETYQLILVSRLSLLSWKCRCMSTNRFVSVSFLISHGTFKIGYGDNIYADWGLYNLAGEKVDCRKIVKDFYCHANLNVVSDARVSKKARKEKDVNIHQPYFTTPTRSSFFIDTHSKLFLKDFEPENKIVFESGEETTLISKEYVFMPKTFCGKPIIETEDGIVIGTNWYSNYKSLFIATCASASYNETIVTRERQRFDITGKGKFEILVTEQNETCSIVSDQHLVYDNMYLKYSRLDSNTESYVIYVPGILLGSKGKKKTLVIRSRVNVDFRTTDNGKRIIRVDKGIVIGSVLYKHYWSEFSAQSDKTKASHAKHYIVKTNDLYVENGLAKVCVWKTDTNDIIYILENGNLIYQNRLVQKWAIKDHPLEYLGLRTMETLNTTCLGIHTFSSKYSRIITKLPSLGLFGKKTLLFLSVGYVVLVGIEEGIVARIDLTFESGEKRTEFYNKPMILQTPLKVTKIAVTNFIEDCRLVKHWRKHAFIARSESRSLYVHLVSSDINYGFSFKREFACIGCGKCFKHFEEWKAHTNNRISSATSFQKVEWNGPSMTLVSRPIPIVSSKIQTIRNGFYSVSRADVKKRLNSKYVPLL